MIPAPIATVAPIAIDILTAAGNYLAGKITGQEFADKLKSASDTAHQVLADLPAVLAQHLAAGFAAAAALPDDQPAVPPGGHP